MGNIKYLQAQKIKGSKRNKDCSRRWVSTVDLESRETEPLRHDLSSFSDDFYKTFFNQNNMVVGSARECGIFDLGAVYETFFNLGMRVSQQLEGRVREITEERYYKQFKKLENSLLEACKTKVIKDELESCNGILQYIPETDRDEAKKIILGLKPVEDSSRGIIGTFNDRIDRLKRKTATNSLEYIPNLPEETRLAYFDLVTLRRRGEITSGIVESCGEEISKIVGLIGPKNGLVYLKLLRERINDNSAYEEIIQHTESYLDGFTPEQIDNLFILWRQKGDLYEAYDCVYRQIANKS